LKKEEAASQVAASIDSQSVKTTKKRERFMSSMKRRKLKEESVIS
jgi:hypothetical protein